MGFAETYLGKQKELIEFLSEDPSDKLGISIIIPCYDEPNIINTLNSIWNNNRPESAVEVIIIINSRTTTPQKIIDQNKKTVHEITEWIKNHNDLFFRFFVINQTDIAEKNAGAGYARKLAMDEAICRFDKINREDGIIISLDADVTLETNYLTEIEKLFIQKPQTNAAIIYYEHPASGKEFEAPVYEAIAKYELYLRYYKKTLEYCGFPYPFYTIGSCFAVSAKAYIKQGGMSRKQAGEDFYFLQKIFSLGNIEELNTTCVYPSPRPSDRVIFGTGPVVKSIIENPDLPYTTYNFESFVALRSCFKTIDQLYKINPTDLNDYFNQLPLPIADFLMQNDFFMTVKEINKNSSNSRTFRKRFFDWFNAFKIIKYLNYVHEKFYQKQELIDECNSLLEKLKVETSTIKEDYFAYLDFFRKTEKKF
ncbi:MAG: glycosyltransferase family 2 protein [Bacteroidales bacterium]